ncbi:hypothetical protein, partial [Escherichia coli]
ETLGGLAVPAGRQKEILESLGFTVEPLDANGDPVDIEQGFEAFRVTAPSWRRDVDGAADLVEEVIRIQGIDHVPSTPLARVPGVA